VIDRIALAKRYLTIAESADSKREAYEAAADELIAWLDENKARSLQEASRRLGRSLTYAGKLVRWRTKGSERTPLPFSSQTPPPPPPPPAPKNVPSSPEVEDETDRWIDEERAKVRANADPDDVKEFDRITDEADREAEMRAKRKASDFIRAAVLRLQAALRECRAGRHGEEFDAQARDDLDEVRTIGNAIYGYIKDHADGDWDAGLTKLNQERGVE